MRIVRYHPRAAVGDGGMTGAIRRWSQSVASLGAEVSVAFEEGSEPPESNGVRWIPVRHGGPGRTRIPLRLEDALRGADLLVLHSAWSLHNVRAAAVARRRAEARGRRPSHPRLLRARASAPDCHRLSRAGRRRAQRSASTGAKLGRGHGRLHPVAGEVRPGTQGPGSSGSWSPRAATGSTAAPADPGSRLAGTETADRLDGGGARAG